MKKLLFLLLIGNLAIAQSGFVLRQNSYCENGMYTITTKVYKNGVEQKDHFQSSTLIYSSIRKCSVKKYCATIRKINKELIIILKKK